MWFMDEQEATQQTAPGRDLSRLAAWTLLTLGVIGFYWKLVLTHQFTWLAQNDLAYQVLPWLQFQAGEWHAGRLPLWDPFQWAGQPLHAQAQPGVMYPLNWILYSLPLRNGWLRPVYLHWYYVIIHLMGAWFAYCLARDLKQTRRASVLAGLVFALAGWMGTNDWPQMLNGAVWAPLVFLFLLRAIRGERVWQSSLLGGFFLGFSWLSGHHQIPIFVALASAGIWLYAISKDRRKIALAAVFFVMAGLAGAAQILPSLEYGNLSVRWVGAEEPVGWDTKVPYEVHKRYSMPPSSLTGILFPGMGTHADPHVGVTVLTLALLGIALGWRRLEVRLLTAAAAGALTYSLGHLNALHGILYSLVPMVEKARSSSFAVFVFGLCIAVLAAVGLDELFARREHPWVRQSAKALLILGCVLFLFASWGWFEAWQQFRIEHRWMVTGLSALLLAALVTGYRRQAVTATTLWLCASGLFLMEITSTNMIYLPSLEEKPRLKILTDMAVNGDIAEFLRQQPGLPRVWVDDKEIPHNFGDWFGVHQHAGYLASLTSNYRHFEAFSDPGFQILGVKYAVRKEPYGQFNQLVFTGRSGLNVYQRPDAFPRVRTFHEVRRISSGAELMPVLNSMKPEELASQAVVTASTPNLEKCGGQDTAEIRHYDPSRVVIEARMACRGLVVLADTDFPGWRATVDGRDTAIVPVYGQIRGVAVDAGRHEIEFKFRPMSVYAGVFISLISLAFALGAVFLKR